MKNQSILSTASIATKVAAKVGFAGLLTSVAMLSQAASDNTTTIPLDMSGMNITKHEIAVMQVISEICPPMLNNKQKQQFYKSYNVQLRELMMPLEDPKAAIQYLSTQQEYRRILQSMRVLTMSFPKQDNELLCKDFVNADY